MTNKYAIVLDTETANSLDDPMIYDVGWAIIDLEARRPVKVRSFAVQEVFNDPQLMNSAFYAAKYPFYLKEIENGTRQLVKLYEVKHTLQVDCDTYGIKQIYAHNAIFDWKSCTRSQRYLTSSRFRYFFPYGVEICDTLKMAHDALIHDEDYKAYCLENGFMTKHKVPRVRLNAETIYRYISGNICFNEMHMGLADVMIEKDILFLCLDRGIAPKNIWERKEN